MNFLLRLTEPRSWAVALLLAVAALLAWSRREDALSAYRQWRYPPQKAASPLARDLQADIERRQEHRIQRVRRRLQARLAAARREGFDVSALEAEALAGAPAGGDPRLEAERLAALALRVPRRQESATPAPDEDAEQVEADVQGRALANQPRPRRRPR